MVSSPDILVARTLAGDRSAVPKLITLVEDRGPRTAEAMSALHGHYGNSYVLGVTGPPGAGKSTLLDCMITHFRAQGKRVGVVAVDPSSPFSGGAVLGDRIRMQRHYMDPDV